MKRKGKQEKDFLTAKPCRGQETFWDWENRPVDQRVQVYGERVFALTEHLAEVTKVLCGFSNLESQSNLGRKRIVKLHVSGRYRQILIGVCFLPGIIFCSNLILPGKFFPDCSVFFRKLTSIHVNILHEYVSWRETVYSVLSFENKPSFWGKYKLTTCDILVSSIAQDWQEQVSWAGENMWSGWMVLRKIQVIRIYTF